MKKLPAVIGTLLFILGFAIGIYKSCYLESYWETTRWEQFIGHPWLSLIAAVLITVGYILMKRYTSNNQ